MLIKRYLATNKKDIEVVIIEVRLNPKIHLNVHLKVLTEIKIYQ